MLDHRWHAGFALVMSSGPGLGWASRGIQVLVFSPDGRVLFVADRSNARVICIEPAI